MFTLFYDIQSILKIKSIISTKPLSFLFPIVPGASGAFFQGEGNFGKLSKEKYTLVFSNPLYSANLIKNLKPKFQNIPFFSINLTAPFAPPPPPLLTHPLTSIS